MRPRNLFLALALPLCLASVLYSASAFADAKTHAAAIKKFFAVAKMDELINSTLEQMTDMQIRGNPNMAPYRATLLTFFRKYMSWDQLEPEITRLYVKEFTEAEMQEITKFYDTPVGRKVMKKLPELSAQGAAIGQARVQDNIQELQAMIAADQARLNEAEAPKNKEPAAVTK